MIVRPAQSRDEDAIWRIIEPTIRAGETYTLPPEMPRAEALAYWFAKPHQVFVAEDENGVIGTYYLRPNQQGGGAHVANCGYMTASAATGRGVARAMCEHSLAYAKEHGFRAVQFNFVISTNTRAVELWKCFGFSIIGTLPGAFNHPKQGFVDAHVMYRLL